MKLLCGHLLFPLMDGAPYEGKRLRFHAGRGENQAGCVVDFIQAASEHGWIQSETTTVEQLLQVCSLKASRS